MGKRRRGKSKRAAASTAASKDANATQNNAQAAAEAPVPPPDVSEDCVMYESAEEDAANGAGAKGEDSDSGASSADEMQLVAPEGERTGADSDVEVTFDFYDPTVADEMPVAAFLSDICQSVAQKASGEGALNARDVAKVVCAQTRVGTVVKITDDSQAIGFITALAVQNHRQLLAPLAARLRKAEAPANVMRAFEAPTEGGPVGPRVGLILSGRVVNLPPQLVPKMFEALLCEVEWATEDEPTEELRKSYDFHWFLYVTDVYPTGDTGAIDKNKKPPRKKSRGKKASAAEASSADDDKIAFTRVEDEIFLGAATHTVTWKIAGEEPGPEGFTRRKMAMFIKKARMSDAFEAVKQLFGVQDGDVEMEVQPESDTKNK